MSFIGAQSAFEDAVDDSLAAAEAALPAYVKERRDERRRYWAAFDRRLIREADRLGIPVNELPEMEKAMSQAVTRVNQRTGEIEAYEFSDRQIELIRRMLDRDATDGELQLYLSVCQRIGLDPFAKEIYAISRFDKRVNRKVMTIQVGIDGLRKKAQESGTYAGQVGPYWCGEDGQWRDVWLSKDAPAAAKVGVVRHGETEPTWGVATWNEFGSSEQLWQKMPSRMLAKCAEAEALRKACPAERAAIRVAVLDAGAQYDDTLASGEDAIEGEAREIEEPKERTVADEMRPNQAAREVPGVKNTDGPIAPTEKPPVSAAIPAELQDEYTTLLSKASLAGIDTEGWAVDFASITLKIFEAKYKALFDLVAAREAAA